VCHALLLLQSAVILNAVIGKKGYEKRRLIGDKTDEMRTEDEKERREDRMERRVEEMRRR
jgi:hypothetical protein